MSSSTFVEMAEDNTGFDIAPRLSKYGPARKSMTQVSSNLDTGSGQAGYGDFYTEHSSVACRRNDDGMAFSKTPLGKSQCEGSCQEAKTSFRSTNDISEGSDSSSCAGDDHDMQGTNPTYNQNPNPLNFQSDLDPNAKNFQCYKNPYPKKLDPTYGENVPTEVQAEDREDIQRTQQYAVRHQGDDDGNNTTCGTVTESVNGIQNIQKYAVRYQGDDNSNNYTRGIVAESGQTIDVDIGEDNIEPYAVSHDDMLGTEASSEDAQRQVPPRNAPVSHDKGNNVRKEQATFGSIFRQVCMKYAPLAVSIPVLSIIVFLVIFFTRYQGSLKGISTNDSSTNGNGNVPTGKHRLTMISGTSEGIYEAKVIPYYMGVAVSADNEIFVTDRENRRVQVFSLDGRYLRQFPTVVPVQYSQGGLPKAQLETGWGLVPGPADGGITFDVRNGRILAAVWVKLLVFKAPEEDGSVYEGRQFEKRPSYTTGHLTTNNEGKVFLSDQSSNTVHVYDTDGTFLFKFGNLGREEGQLSGPLGICVDTWGHIIVANTGYKRVDMFTHSGDFVRTVLNILRPIGVSMSPGGQLVVTSGASVTIVPRQMVYPSQ
ncbi:hypothetical protein Bbelb_085020 [Branchiostoma belcheri]|nr:hypothetical protein Bbelb_085020 [Branchiostoma belcheri]